MSVINDVYLSKSILILLIIYPLNRLSNPLLVMSNTPPYGHATGFFKKL